ncbi:MAG: type II toxin-antitoxin system RelE family toxin [Candidatus Levyibacteriota bacterium]
MYKLRIENEAKKELKVIKDLYGETSLDDAMVEIREFPFIGKPLSRELTGSFSYRIGVYRIIYKIDKKEKTIKIITAGHRENVYE